ncbi:MAG TPA: HDOD domain-containing protein, partial [Fimbriimonadaceae bacterium]|nr:HDOD domain-containing protein [Fimbriimonadaceae bacterium]
CVSERQGLKLSDEGYTAGLLHYLGKTLLDRADSSKYEKVALLMANDVSDVQAEKAVYGCDHVEVGRAATERWGFPEVLLAGMEYQDEPAPDDRFKLVKALVRASDRIAKLAVEGNSGQEMDLERFGCWSPHYLGIHDDETLTRVIGDATEAIASAASFAF